MDSKSVAVPSFGDNSTLHNYGPSLAAEWRDVLIESLSEMSGGDQIQLNRMLTSLVSQRQPPVTSTTPPPLTTSVCVCVCVLCDIHYFRCRFWLKH